MDFELPTEFDLIIVGTGVVESIVSAAASRIGKRVLHLDINNFYGGQWASFNLDSIQKLNLDEVKEVEGSEEQRNDGETCVKLGNDLMGLKNFSVQWHIPEKEEIPNNDKKEGKDDENKEETEKKEEIVQDEIPKEEKLTREQLLKDSRKFNIDLAPKLQFARGDFVELLISSNIARYSEYRNVSRVLTWLNGQLEIVPCSRSDVFANNKVTVIEKRMLMKLFTALDNDEKELAGYDKKSFRTFLKEKKLTPNLIHYVLYAISMSTDETSCLQGIQNTKRFLNSLGRFGKTPFLFSMYGSGEITQAFCRLSAVFGGIYALNQSINGLILNNDKQFKSLLCNKQEIGANHLVIGADKAPKELLECGPKTYISRAVLITDKSIMESEKEHLTLLLYPPENGKNSCTVIELGTLTGTCPKQLYLVHFIAKQDTNPKEDFQYCIDNLFNKNPNSPNILWSCFFSIPEINDLDLRKKSPTNIYICPGPDLDLDYDFSIKKAKDIFLSIYPDAEFLPRAPDPEEIIIEGDPTEPTELSKEIDNEETTAKIPESKEETQIESKEIDESKNVSEIESE